MNWIITDTTDLEKYSEKILAMYESSYKDIGLIDFGGWDGLAKYLYCSCYLLEDKEKEIRGIILYWLSEYGNKISLVISETPKIGKEYVIPKLISLLQTPGFYVELSGALEYLVQKDLDNIKDKKTIKMVIPQLKDDDIFDKDDERCKIFPLNPKKNIPCQEGSFLREIKGIGIHRKALYGLPCLDKAFNSEKCDRECKTFPLSPKKIPSPKGSFLGEIISGIEKYRKTLYELPWLNKTFNRKSKNMGGKKNKTKHKKNKTKHKKNKKIKL